MRKTSKTLFGLMAIAAATSGSYAWADSVGSDDACASHEASSLSEAFTCGSVDGSVRLFSYSTHNGYFADGLDQDTTSIGGYIVGKTAKYKGFQAALGYEGMNRIGQGSNEVGELTNEGTGMDEAWLSWEHGKFKIKAGNQRLDEPFLGEWSDWRIVPYLYRAVDVNYGDKDNFVRATKVFRVKTYGSTDFTKRSRLADDGTMTDTTDGAFIVGAGKKFEFGDQYVSGQLWYEKYSDIEKMAYGELHYGNTDWLWKPDFAVQGMAGNETGDAKMGSIHSVILGAQVVLNPYKAVKWQIGFDRIRPDRDSYNHGALVTPYAFNTSSGPMFAQPFFTSSQYIGSGNAFSTQLTSPIGDNFFLGARYSYMDLKTAPGTKSIEQSEYLLFGSYHFDGALEGFSITDFVGMQTSPREDVDFFENRLQLAYDF